jgi:predicted nucleic acid-binding protein
VACLVDTNVLLRLGTPKDSQYLAASRATAVLRERGESLFSTAQNLIETWNVATRPVDRNGLGFSPQAAEQLTTHLDIMFPRLADPVDTFERWLRIVGDFEVCGAQVHDARLVAVMGAHGVQKILTFNVRDFRRFEALGIRVLNPKDF